MLVIEFRWLPRIVGVGIAMPVNEVKVGPALRLLPNNALGQKQGWLFFEFFSLAFTDIFRLAVFVDFAFPLSSSVSMSLLSVPCFLSSLVAERFFLPPLRRGGKGAVA